MLPENDFLNFIMLDGLVKMVYQAKFHYGTIKKQHFHVDAMPT